MWRKICGYRAYVEDGKIIRAIVGEGNGQRTAYIYKRCKDGKTWTSANPKISTFRNGMYKGSYMVK